MYDTYHAHATREYKNSMWYVALYLIRTHPSSTPSHTTPSCTVMGVLVYRASRYEIIARHL